MPVISSTWPNLVQRKKPSTVEEWGNGKGKDDDNCTPPNDNTIQHAPAALLLPMILIKGRNRSAPQYYAPNTPTNHDKSAQASTQKPPSQPPLSQNPHHTMIKKTHLRHNLLPDLVRMLHKIDIQTPANMPSDMAMKGPDTRVIRIVLYNEVSLCLNDLHIATLGVGVVCNFAVPCAYALCSLLA